MRGNYVQRAASAETTKHAAKFALFSIEAAKAQHLARSKVQIYIDTVCGTA
jgi:hypothetical protein